MFMKKNIALFACLFALNSSHVSNLKAMEPKQVSSCFSEDVAKSLQSYCGTDKWVINDLTGGTCNSKIILLGYETPEKKPNSLVLKFLKKGDTYKQPLENEKFACEKLKNIDCENICPPLCIIELENEVPIVIYRFAEETPKDKLVEFVECSGGIQRSSKNMLKIFNDLLNKKINTITCLFNQGILYIDAHSENWKLICKRSENGDSIEPQLIDFGALLDISKVEDFAKSRPDYNLGWWTHCPITNKALSFFIGSVKEDWENLMPPCIQETYGKLPSLCNAILEYHGKSKKSGRFCSFNYYNPITLKDFLNILTSLSQLSPWLLSEKPKSELDKNLVNFVNQYLPEPVK